MFQLIDKINQLPKNQRLKLLALLQHSTAHIEHNVTEKIVVEPVKETVHSDNDAMLEQKEYREQDDYLLTTLWGKGESLDIPDKSIYELFLENAARVSGKSAISMGDQSITYQALIRKVGQLSTMLKQVHALVPQENIVIYLPRSIEMVVAVLAVLSLGCVFVPIDIHQPTERSKKIIDDSKPAMIITHSSAMLFAEIDVPIFIIDKIKQETFFEEPPKKITSDNLAYIMYTSGTTGTPKGVMIEHRSVVNFVQSMLRLFDITYLDRIVFFASNGFDISIFEIFTALLSGAELVIASDEKRVSPALLSELLRKKNITVAELPPAILPMLNAQDFPCLRLLSVGGEKFSEHVIRSWLSPNRRVINGYGPTEATVAVTIFDYRGTKELTPPIGKPIHNHSVFIIDENKKLCPVGVRGELYISGEGLARGYYHEEMLAQEKFTLLDLDGKKIRAFNTGDLARWRRDGNLEFLGRVDRQIKIKGYRVELGEIESVLLSHPNIKQVVIQNKKHQDMHTYLTAYIVTTENTLTVKEIYVWLKDKLPCYMLPAHVAFIKTVPLTLHGKIDYVALSKEPALTAIKQVDSTSLNDTQLTIQKIFEKYLKSVSLGLEDNFFHMGGDSLSSTQVVNDISKAFSYPLKMISFLRDPTVRHLAQLVDKKNQQQFREKTLTQPLKNIESPWFVKQKYKQASIYLIYFHCAGGSCTQGIRWQNMLDSSIQLIGIQLPGHDQRFQEHSIDNIEKLAELLVPELEDLFEKPVYLMGHSMGALLAYEVCRRLVERKQYPASLIVISSRSPRNLPKENLCGIQSNHVFLGKFQNMGGLSQTFLDHDEWKDLLLPILRSDTKASETFFCDVKIPTPIIAMIGKNDKVISLQDIMAWKDMTHSTFESIAFEGEHFFIQTQESLFIQQLNNLLA